jgi:hypothetical protein
MTRVWRWAAPAALVLILLAGCSRPLKEQVQGKWKQTNGSIELTFLKDGSVTGSIRPVQMLGPVQLSGVYTTPDEQHLKLEFSGVAGSVLGAQVSEARMKDGKLILTLNGQPQEFTRVEEK